MVNGWLERGIAGFRLDAINFLKKDQTWADREPDGDDAWPNASKPAAISRGSGNFSGSCAGRLLRGMTA